MIKPVTDLYQRGFFLRLQQYVLKYKVLDALNNVKTARIFFNEYHELF